MATHSSTLAWKIPWTEEPGRLQSMGSLGVRHDWATSLSLSTSMHWRRKWQPTPVFMPGESQGPGEPGGLPSMGSHRVGHDWSDLAAAAAAAGELGSHIHKEAGPMCHNYWICTHRLESSPHATRESPHTVTKTQHRQKYIFLIKRKQTKKRE